MNKLAWSCLAVAVTTATVYWAQKATHRLEAAESDSLAKSPTFFMPSELATTEITSAKAEWNSRMEKLAKGASETSEWRDYVVSERTEAVDFEKATNKPASETASHSADLSGPKQSDDGLLAFFLGFWVMRQPVQTQENK